ncbi:MAG: hypothetical protein WA918_05760 [Erythrobacter sp.]
MSRPLTIASLTSMLAMLAFVMVTRVGGIPEAVSDAQQPSLASADRVINPVGG